MELRYQLNKEDLLELAKYQYETSSQVKSHLRSRRILYFIGFLMAAVGSFLLYSNLIIVIAFATLAFLSLFFAPTILRWRMSNRLPKIVENKMGAGSTGPRTIELSEDGIKQVVGEMESKVPWGIIGLFVETNEYFFVKIDNQLSLILPKSEFDPDEIARAVQYIKDHSDIHDA
jgi:hypothetical protein